MEANDQELVTFYNNEEKWEFSAPIAPLLKNQVFTAMIDGAFKEANTKKIPMPDFSRTVVERFIRDLTKRTTQATWVDPNSVKDIEHTQLARLAHRFNESQLVNVYLSELFTLLSHGNNKYDASVHYEVCKVVYELSVERYYTQAVQFLVNQPNAMFEHDDDVLLKSVVKRTQQAQSWISLAVKCKAYRCLEALFNEISFETSLGACVSDKSLPEHLIRLMHDKYPNASFVTSRNPIAVGVILRLHPNDHDLWLKAFEAGHMEIIKFAPKDMLVKNKGDDSFGMIALSKGWLNCVELLLIQGWKPPSTALTKAAKYQNPTFVKLLLSHGVKPDCNAVNSFSQSYHMMDINPPEHWSCLDMIERSTLDNALDSELYKMFSKAD